jgi:hypothetical protein
MLDSTVVQRTLEVQLLEFDNVCQKIYQCWCAVWLPVGVQFHNLFSHQQSRWGCEETRAKEATSQCKDIQRKLNEKKCQKIYQCWCAVWLPVGVQFHDVVDGLGIVVCPPICCVEAFPS